MRQLNDPVANENVAAKLRELDAQASQQPISYKWLFEQAMDIADAQFRRAIDAEARLYAITKGEKP